MRAARLAVHLAEPELPLQVEHGEDPAAQVDDAADELGRAGHGRDVAHAADLLHLPHVDAVLLAVEVERDEVLGGLDGGPLVLHRRGEEREAVARGRRGVGGPRPARAPAPSAAATASTRAASCRARMSSARPEAGSSMRPAMRAGRRRCGGGGAADGRVVELESGGATAVARRPARRLVVEHELLGGRAGLGRGRRRRDPPSGGDPLSPPRFALFRASAIRPMRLPSRPPRKLSTSKSRSAATASITPAVDLAPPRGPCPRGGPASRAG